MTASIHYLPIVRQPPKTRGDCLDGPNSQRPCPFTGCRHHMWRGMPFANEETCVLDIVDRDGEVSLRDIADICGMSHQRADQIEEIALRKFAFRMGRLRDDDE